MSTLIVSPRKFRLRFLVARPGMVALPHVLCNCCETWIPGNRVPPDYAEYLASEGD